MRVFRWRKMTWVLIVWTGVCVAWGAGAAASDTTSDCVRDTGFARQTCIDLNDAGSGIAVGVIFFVWFLVFVVLALVWFMTRPKGRTCPACGHDVRKGVTACSSCGHDFRAGAPTASAAG